MAKLLFVLCMLLLIGIGVAVIMQSQVTYQTSINHYEQIKKLAIDTNFKKQVVLPAPGYSLARDG